MSEDRTRSDLSGGIVRYALIYPQGAGPGLTFIPDFQNTQGIIFVVDSNDRERITEAREERRSIAQGLVIKLIIVQRMLSEDELRDALLLVFANKQVSRHGFWFLHLECKLIPRICQTP